MNCPNCDTPMDAFELVAPGEPTLHTCPNCGHEEER